MIFHDADQPQDREFDRSLRPARLAEFVGQDAILENLRVAIQAALGRDEPLDHVLLAGPPGLGKTTIAHLIAASLERAITVTSGPALSSPKDLMGTLTRLQVGDVLFVDEIHRLPVAVEEYLYSAMEDHAIDVVVDQGTASRSIRVTLHPFTLVGATTREGLLSAAFRSRFGLVERLEPYPPKQIHEIAARAAERLGTAIDEDAATLLSERSRGVPRMALRILRRMRDLAEVEGDGRITKTLALLGLQRLRIDALGLEEMDRRILRALADRREPVGLKTLAAMIDETEDTLEDVFEPHLMRSGLIARTPRGRVVTVKGLEHIGRDPMTLRELGSSDDAGKLPFRP